VVVEIDSRHGERLPVTADLQEAGVVVVVGSATDALYYELAGYLCPHNTHCLDSAELRAFIDPPNQRVETR
jgi:hypothetical protein